MALDSQKGRQQPESRIATELKSQEVNQVLEMVHSAQNYISQEYLGLLTNCKIMDDYSDSNVRLHKVGKFIYDRHEDVGEKLAAVYAALYTCSTNYALVLHGTRTGGTDVYMCTESAANYAGDRAQQTLVNSMRGYFPGSELQKEAGDQARNSIILPQSCIPNQNGQVVYSISMYPGNRKGEEHMRQGNNLTVQGLEKLIDIMQGQDYTMIILSNPVTTQQIEQRLNGLRELYSALSAYAQETIAMGENASKAMAKNITSSHSSSFSSGVSHSYGTHSGKNWGGSVGDSSGSGISFFGMNFNQGKNSSSSWGEASGTNEASATSTANVTTDATGRTTGITVTTGSSRTLTYTRENKLFKDLLQKLSQQITHLEKERVQGMWDTSCYVLASTTGADLGADIAAMAVSAYVSLVSGENDISEHCHINKWTDPQSVSLLTDALRRLRHPVFIMKNIDGNTLAVTPALTISSHELMIMASLPRKSVSGMLVDSMAEFGRTFPPEWVADTDGKFPLGWINHMGHVDENLELLFKLQTFASHVFVTGASGSGKSNTCFHLIQKLMGSKIDPAANECVKVLIIEPVKGEYKRIFGNQLNIYCAHPKLHRLLRINPFEFHGEVEIAEHISALCDILSACWPLYGPMPGILKAAVERCYLSCGWDLHISQRVKIQRTKFPTFHDLLRELNNVLEESTYSKQTKGDYVGAMTMRVSSLVNGFEGQIFCSGMPLEDRELFDENVLIDLSSIASAETRALIMGVLIMRLKEYRHAVGAASNLPLQHVTVLEEAHTLLKRCSTERQQDSSNIQAASVQMISEAIAEMRSYGEGFLIVDQSPTAVDIAAIKNTAIKIVMRLPERRDCEDVANALSLNAEQQQELSRLKCGVAAVFHDGWDRTVLAKMGDKFVPSRVYREERISQADLIRLRGAAVSVIIERRQAFLNNGRNFSDLTSLEKHFKRLIQQAPFKTMPAGKKNELAGMLRLLQSDFGSLNSATNRKKLLNRIDERIGIFLLDCLQMRSLLRILTLPEPPKHVGDERYNQAITHWHGDCIAALPNYAVLCDVSTGGRLRDADQNAHAREMLIWILEGYAKERVADGDTTYQEVLNRLRLRGTI